jgi:hypothetical protein
LLFYKPLHLEMEKTVQIWGFCHVELTETQNIELTETMMDQNLYR